MENLITPRSEIVDSLREDQFDITIIGGGITGAGVARDAVMRGFKVALLEKNDFASGTSSLTSKMLHGGLRYLRDYEFRLVRQAALERKVHIEIAPHLSERMQFLAPVYTWSKAGKLMLRMGLFLYDILAFPKGIGKREHVKKSEMINKLPLLENDELVGGSLYWDIKTDDARLTLANVLSAVAGGGRLLNYAEVTSWETKPDGIEVTVCDKETQEEITVRSKVLILCTGPWSEITEGLGKNFPGETNLRLTRGTHLRLKPKLENHPCMIVNDDERPIFLIPRVGYDLAGTTDIDYTGNPDDIAPTREEVDYILDACNKLFPTAKYTKDDVVACFSGVRPLIYQKGQSEGGTSREHSIFVDESGVITLVGGKLTTYRVMAKDAIRKAIKLLNRSSRDHKCTTHRMPLWGGDIEDWENFFVIQKNRLTKQYGLNEESAEIMVKWYGSELPLFEEILKEWGNSSLKPNRPWLEAQVIYSCRFEFARTPIDFLRRRTPIMLEEGNGLDILENVVTLMSSELGWGTDQEQQQSKAYKEYANKFVVPPHN
ncbi:MAG: glycerol-3-phosphate dehydrogenase/oxidase [Candidatus Kariarchaeaceae archaeon]